MGGARTLLAIFIALGLLVFGCTAPSGPGTSTTPGTAGGTGAGNQAAGTGTGAGAGAGTGAGASAGTGTGAGTGAATTGTTDLTGMAYTQLIALGIPVQCDMTTTSQGKSTTIKVYMNGASEVREEVPVDSSSSAASTGCTKMIVILKGTVSYMGCEEGSLFGPSCQWLRMETTPSGGAQTSPVQQPDLGSVPATQISCVPWVYDASKFTVSGPTCTLQDLMGGYGAY